MQHLELNEYTIQLNHSYGLTLAVVADLHEREYDDLLEQLLKIKPSYILLPGDTLERRNEDSPLLNKEDIDYWQGTSLGWKLLSKTVKKLGLNKKNKMYAKSNNGINFIKEASKIAPIILSKGNHEWYFTENDLQTFKECHVVVLDNSEYVISVDHQKLLFGGLSCRYDLEWLKSFTKKNQDKILLCHRPEYVEQLFPDNHISLIISGHAHGGQIRIFNQGLFAPGQGFFPKYTKGLYGHHLVSAGVSNNTFIPRIHNNREICIIHI